MTYSFRPRGICAQEIIVDIDELKGISCGPRPTSCPDQLAQGLEKILAQN